jgi:hypothetical protein
MRVSSSFADHDEVRVPPGTEEMESECRCEGAFSILGMLVKRRRKETGDEGRKENRKRIDSDGRDETGVETESGRNVYYNYGESWGWRATVGVGLESGSER